uniref:PKD domain-containing protein n=1 Tax=candidate division WOR-3 bacterium TaxID=2052148 RepID=A0A7C2P0U6_UNCW3
MKWLFILLLVSFACETKRNSPPVPEIVEIPDSAHPKQVITIKARAIDPDGDYVSIRFDFGDGNISDYSEWVRSGSLVLFEKAYVAPGEYYVSVQARDFEGNHSLWSSGKTIRIE